MSLLVPVVFPREESLTDANVQGLTGFDIVLFGYWKTPEGTDPAVVREEHAVDAEAELYELAAQFSRAGASTDVQLHFGPDDEYLETLQNRIVADTDADAVVIPKRITMWNNVLVPLRDDRNADRIVEFLTAFDPETIFTLELFHVATDESDVDAAREMLGEVERMLLAHGFTESDLEVTVAVAEDPDAAIIERAGRHNVVVIGETEEQTDAKQFLGWTYERIAERTDVPVVVVRK
ncbi:universal stress protein [Halorussus salinisoli]|uniref:universal stress protein n=1 Tax=Halorussus salinisoli TaxID=2558242 RepID=UPI0010C20F08|nr:universal stress protein [Halorussus salinisoli]